METITEIPMFTEEEYFECWLMPLLIKRNQQREEEARIKHNLEIEDKANKLNKFKKP